MSLLPELPWVGATCLRELLTRGKRDKLFIEVSLTLDERNEKKNTNEIKRVIRFCGLFIRMFFLLCVMAFVIVCVIIIFNATTTKTVFNIFVMTISTGVTTNISTIIVAAVAIITPQQ